MSLYFGIPNQIFLDLTLFPVLKVFLFQSDPQ